MQERRASSCANTSSLNAMVPLELARHEAAFPVAVLEHWLMDARRLLEACNRKTPQTLDELRVTYERLGEATAMCEAALLTSLDALDPKTGGGVAKDAPYFERVRKSAFDMLRQTGATFAALSAPFSKLVHGASSWSARPVRLQPDRGDGAPLLGYENTFKSAKALTPTERAEAYRQRVEKFVGRGGRFEDILVASPGTFDSLPSGVHHDYVLSLDGTLRMFENAKDDDEGPVKPGHSLLATGSPVFADAPVLLAGELWVFKDSAGDVEAVVIANNSGHFKPDFDSLQNALPHLEKLGIPAERVVQFGGPNNLDAIFREIGDKQPDAPRGRIHRAADIIRRAEHASAPSPLALLLSEK